MAITAVERRALAGAACLVGAWLLSLGSCTPATPPEQPEPQTFPGQAAEPGREDVVPAAEAGGPRLRIGLAVGVPSANVGGDVELLVNDPAGARLAVIPAGEQWRVVAAGTGVSVQPTGRMATSPSEMIAVVSADPAAPVRVNGRTYRGTVEIVRGEAGITVVNRVLLESYLVGVVSAEMGRRSPAEFEALKAQAVVSRTYALRNLGRRRALGFDLQAGVADQVYAGTGSEAPEGLEAVQATRGQVLTQDGKPIDAFYYSTCGGRTSDGVEAFRAASRTYLRSFPDVDENGEAYCRISPRYRWREEWTGAALLAMLRRTLPPVTGVSSERIRQVRDVWVVQRSASDRVIRLAVNYGEQPAMIEGQAVRQVLRPPGADLLRSSAFTLNASMSGGTVSRLVAEGRGAGHGVGLCQWGAVGRSRAGHDYQRILDAYYPGATLQRLY